MEDPSDEYSIALEYHGPSIPYRIPKVMPLEADLHDTASTRSSPRTPITRRTRWNPKVVYVHDDRREINELGHVSPPGGSRSPVRDEADRVRKRGSCYMCGRGSRFTGREACVVCNAKYCARCVVKAMGSMPEGRKCLGCIGLPIDEARRREIGRAPRILGRVLSSLEVEQIMRAERCCEVNGVRPESVIVNGEPLTLEEMERLESCANPPGKLRPGRYWYDNVSGLWGVEGRKPHKIVTPELNVGGTLQAMASGGDTGIMINGRNITKSERHLLKFAGVPYPGDSHFWLLADGTCQEEGQRNQQGNLWNKPGTRLACFVLSLPFPCNHIETLDEMNNSTYNIRKKKDKRHIQELLLIGFSGSGTSTIFKQARFLYKSIPFTAEERERIKEIIQFNTYIYLGILLEGREQFEEECLAGKELYNQGQQTVYSISPRLKEFSDWLLGIIYSGNLEVFFPASTREYAPLIKNLWMTAAIQATYNRRNELCTLPSVASYFLERVIDILEPDYKVSDQDILYGDGIFTSNGLSCTEFVIPSRGNDDDEASTSDMHEANTRYQLFMVHRKNPCENKWLDMLNDSPIVIFCVALSDYNEHYDDSKGTSVNKMLLNKKLFENIVTHPTFSRTNFLLVLNKVDLLEQKLEQAPLSLCDWFSDFIPPKNRPGHNKNAVVAEQASHYIALKFKTLFASLTDRRLYVVFTNALDSKSVDTMFRHAQEILKWEKQKEAFSTGEISTYNTDPTSSLSD